MGLNSGAAPQLKALARGTSFNASGRAPITRWVSHKSRGHRLREALCDAEDVLSERQRGPCPDARVYAKAAVLTRATAVHEPASLGELGLLGPRSRHKKRASRGVI
jgi:hypothetical protein